MRPLASLLLALTLVGCHLLTTPVGEVLAHPERYEGQTVTIEGEVEGPTNLVVLRYYKVRDGSGAITVVTPRAVPMRGAKVKVTGVVHQAFSIGDQSLTVLNEGGD
jgi:hypothetical protein